jgi:RNA recognition motif-containing protein
LQKIEFKKKKKTQVLSFSPFSLLFSFPLMDTSNTSKETETKKMNNPECCQLESQAEKIQPSPVEPEGQFQLFVGRIPFSFAESEVRELFKEFGTITEIRVHRNKATQQPAGCY